MKLKFNRLSGAFFILMATICFSSMEVMLKLPAVAGVFHPIQITMLRFLIGGACLIPFAASALKKRGIRPGAGDLWFFALTGLLNIPLGMVLFQLSISFGRAGVTAVLFSGNPIFVTMLAFLVLREKIYWNHVAALALDIVGILLIVSSSGNGVPLSSILLVLLSALMFSLYSVLNKKRAVHFGSLTVTCFCFLLGSAELLLIILFGYTGPGMALFRALGLQDLFCHVPLVQGICMSTLPYFLCICVFNSAAGYVFHMLAIEKAGAIFGSLVFFFKPVLASVLALLILHEPITAIMTAAIVFFLSGSLTSIIPNALRAGKT